MVNYKYFDLFFKSSIPKHVSISFGGITLTNDDLYNQEMELEESLCSEEGLRFGSCEASVLKFKSSDIFLPMAGKWLDVRMGLEGAPDAALVGLVIDAQTPTLLQAPQDRIQGGFRQSFRRQEVPGDRGL